MQSTDYSNDTNVEKALTLILLGLSVHENICTLSLKGIESRGMRYNVLLDTQGMAIVSGIQLGA